MIAIIDYDAGNLTSVARAINAIGYENVITNDPEIIMAAERLIFPGVGAAGSAMESLKRLGLDTVIRDFHSTGKPLLGICLGCQIILGESEENNTQCLGLLEGNVPHFERDMTDTSGAPLKIPHMGWNKVRFDTEHPLFKGLNENDEFYFVHSYYPNPARAEHVLGVTEYGIEFTSILGEKNLVAMQFHPEKSGPAGLRILKNFCEWKTC